LKTIEFVASSGTMSRAVDFVIGTVLGATMAHFVIDAGAWRLSQSLQTEYMGKRFDFIIGKAKSIAFGNTNYPLLPLCTNRVRSY